MNRIAAAISGLPWALLVLGGLSTLSVAGKAAYYFFLPLAMLGVVVGALFLTRYAHVRYAAYIAYAFALLALLPYLLFYMGGV